VCVWFTGSLLLLLLPAPPAQLYKTPKAEFGNRVTLASFAAITGTLAVLRVTGW
jgi:hypothetical protein